MPWSCHPQREPRAYTCLGSICNRPSPKSRPNTRNAAPLRLGCATPLRHLSPFRHYASHQQLLADLLERYSPLDRCLLIQTSDPSQNLSRGAIRSAGIKRWSRSVFQGQLQGLRGNSVKEQKVKVAGNLWRGSNQLFIYLDIEITKIGMEGSYDNYCRSSKT